MSILEVVVVNGIAFSRNFIGIITRPYETYRRIVADGSWGELIYLALPLFIYFAFVSLVKTAAFRPFLLTKQFVVLSAATIVTFIVVVVALWLAARLVGGRGHIRGVTLAWGYTLIPTLLWFWATSILYILVPPPRTSRPLGITFSLLYLVFSATLFWWKMILAYLTLRFGMRLDLVRILLVAVILLPFIGVYSWLMYQWGIFKVPFL